MRSVLGGEVAVFTCCTAVRLSTFKRQPVAGGSGPCIGAAEFVVGELFNQVRRLRNLIGGVLSRISGGPLCARIR